MAQRRLLTPRARRGVPPIQRVEPSHRIEAWVEQRRGCIEVDLVQHAGSAARIGEVDTVRMGKPRPVARCVILIGEGPRDPVQINRAARQSA